LPLKRHRRASSCIVLLLALPARAQLTREKQPESQTSTSQTQPPDDQDVPEVPGLSDSLHGWNAGATVSGVHDSVTGWATLFTPAVGYSFNDTFSIDATIPVYMYRLADSRSAHPKPDAQLVTRRAELGDIVFGLHAQFVPHQFQYQLTGLFTAPTGDEAYGLTTGRVTFDISNYFQRTFGRITPNLEIGGGDSTTLVNRTVTKNYTSLGPLAHFQVGLGFDLFRGISFESDAYEQLPIGDQKIYGPSRNGKATVVTGHNVTEDNGFTNTLDVSLNGHITLSGYYSRSLRIHTDTAAIGLTYVLRATPATEDGPIDELFRQPSPKEKEQPANEPPFL
jgi:hypothetical protein